ncbi:hypothetical protein TEA_022314 [Camellia sinensis var. sinensis]|uniref:Uncharacterized protein n=1 Tax=Camellia sinensis var. sinensis TaxID=542762 RepID=A0A4S4D935_CAMSN|nr:hypothetical protein TEA_022314 [Camellia sinensis var. sinensis]
MATMTEMICKRGWHHGKRRGERWRWGGEDGVMAMRWAYHSGLTRLLVQTDCVVLGLLLQHDDQDHDWRLQSILADILYVTKLLDYVVLQKVERQVVHEAHLLATALSPRELATLRMWGASTFQLAHEELGRVPHIPPYTNNAYRGGKEIAATTASSTFVGNETDRFALLAFKSKILQDPHGVVSSWNNSLHFCEWQGVICGHRHRRVTVIDLTSQGLVRSLSPYVGNLTFLRGLWLSNNTFQGENPVELGNLFRLQILNLSNNNFEGEIPDSLSRCSNLTYLGVGTNKLVGKSPKELTSLPKLTNLAIYKNNLTGGISSFIGNLTSLKNFSAARNSF